MKFPTPKFDLNDGLNAKYQNLSFFSEKHIFFIQIGVGYTGLFFKNFTRSSSPQFLFLSFDANNLKIGKIMIFFLNSGFARHKSGQNYKKTQFF